MYFLNINKPKGVTSFDVIRELRKRLKIKQIGHSGTLDPLAYGVMQVAVGSATKLLDYLDSDKEYIASIDFGYVTDTFDLEGEKEYIKEPDFTQIELEKVLIEFIGLTKQIPPKYSAIKYNGKKLCDLTRQNKEINIEDFAREIEIYSIELLEFSKNSAKIKVNCKKGTYIRSLVNDIGLKLGCGATLSELIRTKAGNFTLDKANLISDNLVKINPLDALNLEKIEISDFDYQRVLNGNFIDNSYNVSSDKVLLTKNNKLVSIANLSDNLIKPKKVFKEDE